MTWINFNPTKNLLNIKAPLGRTTFIYRTSRWKPSAQAVFLHSRTCVSTSVISSSSFGLSIDQKRVSAVGSRNLKWALTFGASNNHFSHTCRLSRSRFVDLHIYSFGRFECLLAFREGPYRACSKS
jgi:hypothetical protein